ncbi:MAG: hypothetical protein NVS4B11_30320 [Ktedonobacteraceae bacterium]
MLTKMLYCTFGQHLSPTSIQQQGSAMLIISIGVLVSSILSKVTTCGLEGLKLKGQ